MKKIFLVVFLILASVSVSYCQTTSVTFQVTDVSSQTWNNGTWSAILASPPGISPTGPPFYQAGTTTLVPNQTQSGSLSVTGSATMTFTQNAGITPTRSSWNFTVCGQTTAINNCYTQSVTITSSTTVTLTPPALTVNAGQNSVAYADSEVTGSLGQTYYNSSTLIYRVCQALPCSSNWFPVGGVANQPGIPINAGNIFFASAYGVKGGGIRYCDAAWGSGSQTVTVNNTTGYTDTQFNPTMTGWIVYGTNADCNNFNIQTGTATQVPLGTLTVASTGNTATISTTTTGACTSSAGSAVCSLMIFPQDDGPNLQTAYTAAIAACANGQGTTLVLPITNFYSSVFITGPSSGQCGGGNDGDGGVRLLAIQCAGVTGCVLYPSPGLNWTSVAANNGGFFSNPTFATQNIGFRMRDFTIDCAGIVPTNGGNGTNKSPLYVAGNSILENVGINRCQTNFGLQTNGSDGLGVFLSHIHLRGDGSSTGFALNASTATYITNSNLVWSEGGLAEFTCTNAYGKCVSIGNQYELGSNGTTGIVLVTANANNYVDFIEDHIDASNNNNQPFLEVAASAGGLVHVTNTDFTNPIANGDPGIQIDSGATVAVSGSRINLSSLTGIGISNAGTLNDLGGIVNTSVTPYSGAGVVFGSASITGTALSTGGIGLTSGWGASTVATASGDSHAGRFTITGAAGSATPTLTLTFPTAFYVAPASCQLIETGANDLASLTNPVSATAGTTSVVFTLTGTPVAVTYQFDYRCAP